MCIVQGLCYLSEDKGRLLSQRPHLLDEVRQQRSHIFDEVRQQKSHIFDEVRQQRSYILIEDAGSLMCTVRGLYSMGSIQYGVYTVRGP